MLEYEVLDVALIKSVEPVHVVEDVAERFENCPRIASAFPDCSVKFDTVLIVVLSVDVALFVMVHPPDAPPKIRS